MLVTWNEGKFKFVTRNWAYTYSDIRLLETESFKEKAESNKALTNFIPAAYGGT